METATALRDLCVRTAILETKMQKNIDETMNISSKVKKLMEMMQGLQSRLEDAGFMPRRADKQSMDSGLPSALLPTPTNSTISHAVHTEPLQQHEVRNNSIIDSTDATQTILDESTTIEVTLKPIPHNLLSSLLPSKKIPAEKENLVSKSQFVALSCVENLCTEAVRQNAYESLSSALPPEKPPDEFVNERNINDRILSYIREVDTLSQEADPKAGKLYITGTLSVHTPVSWFIRKTVELAICHCIESTMVDDNTCSRQLANHSISLLKFLEVEEKIQYEPHSWTICHQQKNMSIRTLSTLAEKVEKYMEFRPVDVFDFDIAERATRQFLEKFKTLVVLGERTDKEVPKMVTRMILRTKMYKALGAQLTDIVVNAIFSIRKPDEAIDLFMAEILHMRHKFDLDTRVVEGLVLNHCSRNPDMKRRAEDLESLLCQLAKVNSIRLPTHVTSKLKHNSNAEVNYPKGLIIAFSLKKSNDVENDGKSYLAAEGVTDGAQKGDVKAYEIDQMHFDSMSEGQAEEKYRTENEANITEGKDIASRSRVCDDEEKKKHEKTKAPECIPMNVVMREDSKTVFQNQKFGTVKFIILKIGEATGYIRFEDPTRSQKARATTVLAEDGGIASTVLQVCIYKRKHLVLMRCVLDLLVDKTNLKKYKGLASGIG